MVKDYYINRAAAFIDIIGFSELVRRTENDLVFAEALEKSLRTIKSYGDANNSGLLTVSTFSDSIVISVPLQDKPGVHIEDGFSIIFPAVFEISNILLQQDIIIRGAIAVGKLYHEDGVLFGPAMLDAVGLEKKEAKFPRVIVVEDSLNFPSGQLRHNQHLADDNPLKNFVAFMGHHFYCLRDEDGKLFINFLGMSDIASSKHWRLPKEDTKQYFSNVRDCIISNFNVCSSESNVEKKKNKQDKWRWLTKYFNWVISEKGFQDLHIPEDLIDWNNFAYPN